VIGDTRIADRAEIDRVERHQSIDAVVAAPADDALATRVQRLEAELDRLKVRA